MTFQALCLTDLYGTQVPPLLPWWSRPFCGVALSGTGQGVLHDDDDGNCHEAQEVDVWNHQEAHKGKNYVLFQDWVI